MAQQWDQLNQLGMRIRHNLEQQIQARNQSGVTEDQLKEFSMMFRHFDKDKSGKLSHDEFKSCLRALGYDLPVAEEEGEEEPEFDAILAIVDPNKDGSVQLQVKIWAKVIRVGSNTSWNPFIQKIYPSELLLLTLMTDSGLLSWALKGQAVAYPWALLLGTKALTSEWSLLELSSIGSLSAHSDLPWIAFSSPDYLFIVH